MTTIAWDGKIVAADSRLSGAWYDDRRGGACKIAKIESGRYANHVIALAGRASMGLRVLRLLGEGIALSAFDIPVDAELSYVLFSPVGDHVEFCVQGDPFPLAGFAPFALGSGQTFAMGAMFAGANAIEAVRIAIRLDEGSGGEVVAYDTTTMERVEVTP